MIHPWWISISIFIFISIIGLRKIYFLTFSCTICLQPFSRKRTLLCLCYHHRCRIFWRYRQLQSPPAKETAEKLSPFISLFYKRLFSQKEEGNRNGTEYSTHTLSHLNANISLIISQTKKCFGLKNCLDLSFFCFLLIFVN